MPDLVVQAELPTVPTMAAAAVVVAESRCLNRRHKEAGCRRCVDVCPRGAIEVNGSRVRVMAERCVGCGACLPTCPTEVFSSSEWDECRVLGGLPSAAQAVSIACARRSEGEIADDGVVHVGTCLAALSPGLLFEVALRHRVGVLFDACATCPLGGVAPHIAASVDQANSWLRAVGGELVERVNAPPQRPAAVSSQRRSVSSRRRLFSRARPASTHPYVAEDPRVDRRRFLRALLWNGASAYMDLVGVGIGTAMSAAPTPGPSTEKRPTEDLLPRWRAHLATCFASLENAAGQQTATWEAESQEMSARETAREVAAREAATWPTLAVNEDCSACGDCERLCPTTALSSAWSEEEFALRFTPGACVECGLCARICLPGAVVLGRSPLRHPFATETVFERETRRCSRCGAPVSAATHDLCELCRSAGRPGDVVESARAAFRPTSAQLR